MTSSDSSSRYPVEVAYLPVVRCAVCRRTVAHRPGQASAVLTTHYQRAHPEILIAGAKVARKPPGNSVPSAGRLAVTATGSAAVEAAQFLDRPQVLCARTGSVRPERRHRPPPRFALLGRRAHMWPAVAVGVTAWFRACWSGADHGQENTDADRVVRPVPAAVRALAGAPAGPADRGTSAARSCGPSARTATPASRTAATRPASWSTWSPTRWRRAATRWSPSAACSRNHTRQVAAVAAYAGLKCVLVQESWVDWPDAVYDKVGNILISRLAGADVRLVKAGFGIGFKESWDQALARSRSAAASRTRSRPARPTTRSAGSASRAGRRGGRQEARARGLLRHDRRLLGDRQHAGRDDRRLRRARASDRGRAGSSASTARPSRPRPASRSPASPGTRRS